MPMIRKMYHTQEKRDVLLKEPLLCFKHNAWLGVARYFWYDENDAVYWGIKSKRATGQYEVYTANINCENVLDTVFNEEHYLFWLRQIKKAELTFIKAGKSLTLKQLNDYFLQHDKWTKLDGIMFQDISPNPIHYFVKDFQYKKRIQLAAYNLSIISNFALAFEGKCV